LSHSAIQIGAFQNKINESNVTPLKFDRQEASQVRKRWQKVAAALAIALTVFMGVLSAVRGNYETRVLAEAMPTPTPATLSTAPTNSSTFDQAAAIAALKEQIKGHENDPATTVFKNIKTLTGTTAGRLLSVMQFGFGPALGVDCTHCHVPGKWESEERPEKQIARDMSDMTTKINKELLKNIKNLKSPNPIVNCTTCHRGQVKPATNMPPKA